MMSKFFHGLPVFNKQKAQLGFTLIELIIAIAVIGLGMTGIVAYQSRAETAQATQTTVTALTALGGTITNVYSGVYGSATVANLTAQGLVRPPLRPVGANLESPLGIVTVIANTNTFAVSFNPKTFAECAKAVEMLLGAAQRVAVGGALVAGGTTVAASITAAAPGVAWNVLNTSPSANDIRAACQANTPPTVQFAIN